MRKTNLLILFTLFCLVMAGAFSVYAFSKKPVAKPYCETKYPIMLVHGFCGFDDFFGLIDYFYKVPDKLKKDGAKVRAALLSAVGDNTVRGEQLLKQIQAYLAETGAKKVNIIAHSHGCTTSRYVIYHRPDLVASFTSIAGPHKGSPVADFALDKVPGSVLGIADTLLNFLGDAIAFIAGGKVSVDELDQSTTALLYHFSQAGIEEFNNNTVSGCPSTGVPTSNCGEGAYLENVKNSGNIVRYYSWTGSSQMTNVIDVLDYLWPILHAVNKYYGKDGNDDGFVQVCSAHFGEVLKDNYKWNHADEVNHLFGIRGLFTEDPVSVYHSHVNRLQKDGY